jgi:hypothetical protein
MYRAHTNDKNSFGDKIQILFSENIEKKIIYLRNNGRR